jgi:hypothetical protein
MLNIEFKKSEEKLMKLQKVFNNLNQEALYMDHYQLAAETPFSAQDWKTFLTDPRVSDYINDEFKLLKQAKFRASLRDMDNITNTAQAQLLNNILNHEEKNTNKEGPYFVYTYIPLNKEEQQADNTYELEEDPFLRGAKKAENSPKL